MIFEMVSNSGLLMSAELTERSDCIRLTQGWPMRGEKKPLDLDVEQSTRVGYPVDRPEPYVCHVKRTE